MGTLVKLLPQVGWCVEACVDADTVGTVVSYSGHDEVGIRISDSFENKYRSKPRRVTWMLVPEKEFVAIVLGQYEFDFMKGI